MNTRPPTQAFTLIEMMISVSLGMAIVYVAVIGFNVAAQSISITNRMAIETAILRAGCVAANERLDFWTDYDDPDNTADQRLRGSNATGGLPFTPMSVVFPLVRHPTDQELTRGWDPAEPWKAADPRTWWRGNLAEKFQSGMLLGRYGIFGNTQPPVLVTGAAIGIPGGIGTYGTVQVAHEWYYKQVWGLHNALGYYGYAEYLPQNTLFACHQDYQIPVPGNPESGTNQDGMPLLLFKPGTSFDNGEGGQEYPKGLWRLTMLTSYAVVSPTSANAGDPRAHRSRYTTGYHDNPADFRRFLRETENGQRLLDGPGHWAQADVTLQRFIKTGRFVNLCRVRLVDKVSGAITEVAYTGFGTTLRGARLQRRHPSAGGGWSDHDNRVGVADDPTLDHTP
jgi:hypothetical protein